MESKTKAQLTREQIIKLVKANFGEDTAVLDIAELADGMCNAAYVIDCEGKPGRIVLKVSMPPTAPLLWHEGDNMVAEVEAYRLVREQTSVPIPRILCHDFSRKLTESRYFFMEYLTGEVYAKAVKKITPENKARLKHELAQYLAQIHRIQGKYFGYITTDPDRRFATWRSAYEKWFAMVLRDAGSRGYRLPYERIRKALTRTLGYLDEIREPRLIHNDFWGRNLFVSFNGREYDIQALTDFERAVWGDPLAEFHSNGMIIGDVWKEPDFWRSYAGEGPCARILDGDDVTRIHLYKLYLWLIMVAETYRYTPVVGAIQRLYSRTMARISIRALEKAPAKMG